MCCVVFANACVPQSLAKLTVNFQSSLSICDSASEAANNTGNAGDSCNLQQYCDTGCQTDIMGEVGGLSAHTQTHTQDVSMCGAQETSANSCAILTFLHALAAEMTSPPPCLLGYSDILPHLPSFFVSGVFQYGPQDSSHLLDKVKVNWQYEEAKKK